MELAVRVWHHPVVAKSDPDDPRTARMRELVALRDKLAAELGAVRQELADEIANAIVTGVRPSALAKLADYTPDYVRKIAREHGLPPLREATVVAIRKDPEKT
jgi:hypothetical protein